MADLYDQLSSIALLRRAWHLARNDARTDFMFDTFRFADFAFDLDTHLSEISRQIAALDYRPQPLRSIDVPKSTLAVRPGSVLAIEDKVVLFAIACLIAPRLDRLLPDSVYSWRVKKGATKQDLFEDHEILRFPFLKRTTIERRLEIVEPWYGQWPRFIEDSRAAYEREGYKYLVLSDIASYFENIDHIVLRDLLLRHLPRQLRTVNFVANLLAAWVWPTIHGSTAPRGIPQGFGVSSFLGNIYLLPLDHAFRRMVKRGEVRYLRYMDDVKVLARDLRTAREALFLMNATLRSLRLNIQASKTRILEGQEARDELSDPRLEEVNRLVKSIDARPSLAKAERQAAVDQLRACLKKVKGKKTLIRDRELRLFRRLMTGYTLLRHPGALSSVLAQVERNPDARLLNSATRYLRSQNRNLTTIPGAVVRLLRRPEGLFHYQAAHLLLALRYLRDPGTDAFREARRRLGRKLEHAYVREQAALLMTVAPLRPRQLRAILALLESEGNPSVRLALIKCLSQLDGVALRDLAERLLLRAQPREQRVGRFFHALLNNRRLGLEQVERLKSNPREDVIIERLFELDLLSNASDPQVRGALAKALPGFLKQVRRPHLSRRLAVIRKRVDESLQDAGERP
ncbi:MAG: RNA-directed DNA polymerase [Vicinamibacteria bacterium]|nr:RNA-directed DNA polymerase [Vicinamibacteria bacterium]